MADPVSLQDYQNDAYLRLLSKFPKRYKAAAQKYLSGLLQALAVGDGFIDYTVQAVHDNLLVVSATGSYLDQRAGVYGVVRDQATGIQDQDFQRLIPKLGMSPKQIASIMNDILDIVYGPLATRANMTTQASAPYALEDGWNLTLVADHQMYTVKFVTADFLDIAAATAGEVAGAITRGTNGAIVGQVVTDIRNGDQFVQIYDRTIGAQGFLQVTGGSAQPILLFPSVLPTVQGIGTWSVSRVGGGDQMMYTFLSGVSPAMQTSGVKAGNLVTIRSDSGFALANTGTFPVVSATDTEFVVENPAGVPQASVTNGHLNDFAFYQAENANILLASRPATVLEVTPGQIDILLPVSSPLVKRFLAGSEHLHGGISTVVAATSNTLQLGSTVGLAPAGAIARTGARNMATGFVSSITANTITLIDAQGWPSQGALCSGVNNQFYYYQGIVGNTLQNVQPTPFIYAQAVDTIDTPNITFTAVAPGQLGNGIFLAFNGTDTVASVVTAWNTAHPSNTVTYTGLGSVVPTAQTVGPIGGISIVGGSADYVERYSYSGINVDGVTLEGVFPDPTNSPALLGNEVLGCGAELSPNYAGSFLYDPKAPFEASNLATPITQEIPQGSSQTVVLVQDAEGWPQTGYVVFGFDREDQEGPIAFSAVIGSEAIILDPSHQFQNTWLPGSPMRLVRQIGPYVPRTDGQDLPVYITSTSPARDAIAQYLADIAAAGVVLNFVINVPSEMWPVLTPLYTTGPLDTSLAPPLVVPQ